MEFLITLYETASGHQVVQGELDDIERVDAVLYDLVLAGLNKLRRREYHRPPLCIPLDGGLYELRVGGAQIARALWFFQAGRRIVVVRCFVKKSAKAPLRELRLARRRMADYVARHPPE